MENKSPEKKEISPELYRKILHGLDLKNIFIISGNFNIDRNNLGTDLKVKIDDNSTFRKLENNDIEITLRYSLEAKNRTSKKRFLTIKADYCLLYSSKEDFSGDFFETFKKVNLPINSWPFFRELVYSITSRMFIPPITLPLVKR